MPGADDAAGSAGAGFAAGLRGRAAVRGASQLGRRPCFDGCHGRQGYPGAYSKGTVISGLEALPDTSSATCFHAGTAKTGASITAEGGRVLNVTARAASLSEARRIAYEMVDQIDWPQGFCRRDIGWRAL